jgi:hypothetical protein
MSRVVPRREVRHLGPLERPVSARAGRLVRAEHVYPGQRAEQVPRPDLRPSLEGRFQGYLQPLESGEVGPREADCALPAGGGQIFRRPGQPSLQLRLLRLEVSALEQRGDRSQEGHRGRLGHGGAQGRPAVRRDRSCRTLLELVRGGPGRGRHGAHARHRLRRQAHQGRRQGPVVGRARSAGPLCAEPPARREAVAGVLREVLPADARPDRQLPAGPALFRRRRTAAHWTTPAAPH